MIKLEVRMSWEKRTDGGSGEFPKVANEDYVPPPRSPSARMIEAGKAWILPGRQGIEREFSDEELAEYRILVTGEPED